MTDLLGPLPAARRSGDEPLHLRDTAHGTLLGFWAWAYSGLAGNTLRGVLAEYIVALALGVADGARTEWDAVDLRVPGGPEVEVKSSAHLQQWAQTRPSSITFSIAPAEGWDARTARWDARRLRRSDVYVFCLLDHRHKPTLDPLDLSQWIFYVLPTRTLDEQKGAQATISLSSLIALEPVRTDYDGLRTAVLAAHAPS